MTLITKLPKSIANDLLQKNVYLKLSNNSKEDSKAPFPQFSQKFSKVFPMVQEDF